MGKTRKNASTSQNSNSDEATKSKRSTNGGQQQSRSRRVSKSTQDVKDRGTSTNKSMKSVAQLAGADGTSKPITPAAVKPALINPDDDWVSPDYNDVEFFYRESHRCQVCNKTFEGPSKASLCITSHKVLRCYFCFIKVYKTTDDLFAHFSMCHKHPGGNQKENYLNCHFCEEKIPFQSASCHVISSHLKQLGNGEAILKKSKPGV